MIEELKPLPKLLPPPKVRNWLLKFESQRGQNEWLTVYCTEGEICPIAEKVEERLGWKFRYDWTEL